MMSTVCRQPGRMAFYCVCGVLLCFAPDLWAAPGTDAKAQGAGGTARLSLSIEGISANVGEDEPRVLTILPWRAPTLPRRPRAELESTAPELVQPLDALVLERHRVLRQSMGVANPGGQPGARR